MREITEQRLELTREGNLFCSTFQLKNTIPVIVSYLLVPNYLTKSVTHVKLDKNIFYNNIFDKITAYTYQARISLNTKINCKNY